MGKSILLSILIVSVTPLPGQTYQNIKRLVYLFGPDQQLFNQQLGLLNLDKAGCDERDVKIILADTVKHRDDLYTRYQAKPNLFMVVLVGKDGGEKFRSTKPVSTDQLFGIIDQMPMRKQEMKL